MPIAQFDKIDFVQGSDPMNSANYLGDNTGIVHTFVDSTVSNGVNYSYTITAYDSGSAANELESLESARGTTASDANLVDVTPRSNPIGYVAATSATTPLSGAGNSTVTVQIVDPSALTGDSYLLSFNNKVGTPADSFYVTNERTRVRLTKAPLRSDAMNVVDGFRLRLDGDTQTGSVKSITDQNGNNVYGSTNLNPDGKWYVKDAVKNASADTLSIGAHYEFRFTSAGSFAAGLTGHYQPMVRKYSVPFEIWNTTVPGKEFQIGCVLIDKNANNAYDSGDEIRINNAPYAVRGDTISTFSLYKWYYTVTIGTSGATGSRLPVTGERFTIESFSQLSAYDTLRVRFTVPTVQRDREIVQNSLSRVRVVPNPFIVNASWEQVANSRRLRFMYLPPECTIGIYTMTGELVNRLIHTNGTGDEDWNLTNQSGVEVAFGLYIYVVETPNGEKSVGKFSIIK